MGKPKISSEEKVYLCQMIIDGKRTVGSVSSMLGLHKSSVQAWVIQFREQGAASFEITANNKYSAELKQEAVIAYINGKGSIRTIAARYGVRSSKILWDWIKMYNNGEDFSQHKMSGGSRMKTSRSTTKEERIQIVRECIANGCNYGECAIKYNVSYQQVYSWVKRFKDLGEAGLEDRRGRRKVDQEPRSEVEELKIKMAQLEHELYMTKMERDLLKKVKELERKELYRK